MRKFKNRRGQGLVEYIIIVAAVAMISLVAVSVFGHKVADQYAISAGLLPGAHAEDNLPVTTGSFVGTTSDGSSVSGNGQVSWASVTGNADGDGELENNVIANSSNDGEAFVAD
ncbi:class III signal peptide-containing protein [Rhodopirellula sp. JC639]|uniref:class III signal peptide-containing protein n=1 Tax=Stieleria mannarensis TaxID=2755585 RepID=UPI00160077AC|nr:class III signal peptide-containing protein [Rhodopirellula sp. JC639]